MRLLLGTLILAAMNVPFSLSAQTPAAPAPTPAAQGTWHDLKFGMSLADVRSSLAKEGLTLERSEDGWDVKPGWDAKLPTSRIKFHFAPRVMFSETGTLWRVDLNLDVPKHAAEGSGPKVLTGVAAAAIHKQLVAKYGAPIVKEGVCDKVASTDLVGGPGHLECETVWSPQGQSVTLVWFYKERGEGELVLSITYVSSEGVGL